MAGPGPGTTTLSIAGLDGWGEAAALGGETSLQRSHLAQQH